MSIAEKKRKRAPTDARCAWRAMDGEQRAAFLRWVEEQGHAIRVDGLVVGFSWDPETTPS